MTNIEFLYAYNRVLAGESTVDEINNVVLEYFTNPKKQELLNPASVFVALDQALNERYPSYNEKYKRYLNIFNDTSKHKKDLYNKHFGKVEGLYEFVVENDLEKYAFRVRNERLKAAAPDLYSLKVLMHK